MNHFSFLKKSKTLLFSMQDINDYFVALRLSVGLFSYEEENIGIVYLFFVCVLPDSRKIHERKITF